MPTNSPLPSAIAAAATRCLDRAMMKIHHCLGQLTDEQIWWRPTPEMNSIGNLMLHLAGNLRQWVVAGIGGAEDHRNRPLEFSERGPVERAVLVEKLESSVADAKSAIAGLTEADLLEVHVIQGFEVTGAEILFDCLPHFQGHTQEIISFTRMQLGPNYRFEWTPKATTEGAE